MTIERKVGMGIAGQPSGATDVAEVFSTDLYIGNGGTNVINNGIDLAGEGGMVWNKRRNDTGAHTLADTERGISKVVEIGDNAETTSASGKDITSFNSNGFTFGIPQQIATNVSSAESVTWTFRKKKKFFDVVTWTGNSVQGRAIPHGLDNPVGMIIIKTRSHGGSSAYNWAVYHRSMGGTKSIYLNTNAAQVDNDGFWNDTDATSTNFIVGNASNTNATGRTYVAYVFADNSSEDLEDQIIKCGSYTGAYPTQVAVTLGWEPQFILVRPITQNSDWNIQDSMRGIVSGGSGKVLDANSSAAEGSANSLKLTATGFETEGGATATNANGATHIYMAIRAPMMVEPEAATDVFASVVGRSSNSGGKGNFLSGFPVDFGIAVNAGGGTKLASSRLTGDVRMKPSETAAENQNAAVQFDYSDGWATSGLGGYNSWMWKRAKGYFDVVAYPGTGSATTVAHSLSVIPELLICKRRSDTEDWTVYNSTFGASYFFNLNDSGAVTGTANIWNNTAPTSTVFSVGAHSRVNSSGHTYIAYLFATLDGISKVGSYTGNGSSQTISCGFSAGSRFILIKRTDATGDWYVWDTTRGIVAGNDPHLSLNTTDAQVTNDDSVDPHNSGFIVNQVSATNINVSSHTYIFYAIA